MSSTDNLPSLTLSDIMYHMSPSPAPPDELSGLVGNTHDFGSGESSKDTFTSQEAYSQLDVAGIRRRLNELGFSVVRQRNAYERNADSMSSVNISSREKELLDMVISLTETASADPAQLERQAETIANLTTQRDFIARQIEEERERWRSERESWDRTAEALLSQRNKPSKSEDAERMRVTYESENRLLRDKLQDSQKRLSSLESELMRLKPMLLMQPFTSSRHDKGKGRETVSREHLVSIPEDRETNDTHEKTQYYPYNYQPQSQPKIANSPATASTSKAGSGTQPIPPPRRRSRDHTSSSKSQGKRHNHPLTSDAYTEHILLAAKKIGRRRAAVVAGIMQHAEREKEALVHEQEQIRSQKEQERMEQERQERIANGTYGAYYRTGPEASTSSPQRGGTSKVTPAPRTPKRNALHYSNMGTGSSTHISTSNMESPLVYVNVNPAASSYGSPWAGSGVMGTPGQIKSALNRQNGRAGNSEKAMASNPPTPLASLLDAALMMNEDGTTGSKQRGKVNGKGRALEEPDSPVPKRRKTSSAGKHVADGSGGGLDRVKSALDVLADQADQAAAAFNETDQSDKRASAVTDSGIILKGKGKAKEKPLPVQDLEDEPNDPNDSRSFTQESTYVPTRGRGRPRRDSGATRTRAGSITASAVASSRPVRQASRKRAASPDHHAAPSTSATTRGSARGRGRPKGSTSKSGHGRSDGIGGPSRMISPPGLRVIAHPPGYSPLDEALAMSSNVPANNTDVTRHRSAEHTQQPHAIQVSDQLQSTEPKIGGLRPVVGWGDRNVPSLDFDSSPLRDTGHVPSKNKDSSPARDLSEPLEPLASELIHEPLPIPRSTPEILRHRDSSSNNESPTPANGHTHVQDQPSVPLPRHASIPDVQMKDSVGEDDLDADADAEVDEDQDAEGEQEDGEDDDCEGEGEGEGEGVSTKHPSRSRSPPPPDPPPPGPDNGSPPDQGDEHDPDADAEGEMDFEDNEDTPSGGIGSMSSSARKATTGDLFNPTPYLLSNTFFLLIFSFSVPDTPFHRKFPTLFISSVNPIPMRVSSLLADLSENINAPILGITYPVLPDLHAKQESECRPQRNKSQVSTIFFSNGAMR